MNRLAKLAVVVGALFCSALLAPPRDASAQDWTRFRGPNGQGQSDAATIPDLVRRDFTADTPGTKLVGDITY